MRRTLTGAVDGLHGAAWGPMMHLDLLGAHPAQACPKSAIHAVVLGKVYFRLLHNRCELAPVLGKKAGPRC